MVTNDARGLAMSGADAAAAALYEDALAGFQCYVGDPFALLDRALAEQPDFVMAHLFRAQLFLSGVEPGAMPQSAESLAKAKALPKNDREERHLAAAQGLYDGEWELANQRFEALLVAYPRDAVALQMAHLFDFYRGDARNLRDRVARRFHAWSPSDPGYHALVAMHAFGLEEMGQYEQAEEKGRAAIAMNPRDGWAYHAVAHVKEMLNRPDEGIAWLSEGEQGWAPDSFFAVHNWWHLALYHLEQDQTEKVLALYDGPIRGKRSSVILDMVDASAMLWRLHLRGHDVGPRWAEIAEAWAPMVKEGLYCFNDLHAMMAFVGAGRTELAERQLTTLKRRVERGGSNQSMTAVVGLPTAEAVWAFGRGDWQTTIDRLVNLRPLANRFGGSHAQRDILDLTLLEAAKRAGDRSLLAALAAERLQIRPASPLAQRYRAAAESLPDAA